MRVSQRLCGYQDYISLNLTSLLWSKLRAGKMGGLWISQHCTQKLPITRVRMKSPKDPDRVIIRAHHLQHEQRVVVKTDSLIPCRLLSVRPVSGRSRLGHREVLLSEE